MIALPPAIAPWAAELAAFPAELAIELAPWLGRLSLAVGPFVVDGETPGGEPDGYRGLARRGSYERLVTAEWGVAELFPEEFIRRASAGEHLFFDLARREPRATRHSLAIVSAGPAQLGTPRLAQLAALIVLARRAAAAGATFTWGVLEDPQQRVVTTLDVEAIRRFLTARTANAADSTLVEAWRERFEPETWIVADAIDVAAVRRAGATHSISVRDRIAPFERVLDVEIERRYHRARLQLELPAEDVCTRLLRDPFPKQQSASITSGTGTVRTVRFAQGGRRLLVIMRDGAVQSWPLPSSPREPIGQPKKWQPPSGHKVLAVGTLRRAPFGIAASPKGDVYFCGQNDTIVRLELPETFASRLAEFDGLGSCGFIQRRRDRKPDLVFELAGELFVVLDFDPARRSVAQVLDETTSLRATVLAVSYGHDRVLWVENSLDDRRPVLKEYVDRVMTIERFDGGRAVPRCLIGPRVGSVSRDQLVAVERDSQVEVVGPHWLAAGRGIEPLPFGGELIGVYEEGRPTAVTRVSPYRLGWQRGAESGQFPMSSARILDATVSPYAGVIAWVTGAGLLVLYSIAHQQVLARLYFEVPT